MATSTAGITTIYDQVNAGGLMRCCLLTLDEHYPDGPARKAAEGEVLPCKYCRSSMVFRAGWWGWQRDPDGFAGKVAREVYIRETTPLCRP